MNIKETLNKSKTEVRYISRSPRVPREARCIEGCERETLTTNGLIQRFLNHTKLIYGAMLLASVFLTACGGGGGATTPTPSTTYTIGGTVSGLTGTVVLQNNGGNNLSVSANGSFTFTTAIANGAAYAVTVLTQPTGQICTPSSNTGTVSGANVTSVSVVCSSSSSTHTIGGTISGLSGTVVLQNNGGDDLTRSVNGSFTFATPVAHTAAYAVTVLTQPAGQRCTVSYGTGFAIANVTGITVNCVAVYTVSVNVTNVGTSRGLILQNTGSVSGNDNLAIPATGIYTFTKKLAATDIYNVKVFIQPAAPALTCTSTASVTPASGTMPASAITVDFACATPLPVHAYVANTNGDSISAYTIAGGAFTQVLCGGGAGCNVNDFSAGSKPKSVTVDPSGKFAYVANFAIAAGSGDISAYKITAGTGALTPVSCAGGPTVCNGANYKAGSNPQAVAVDPSGRFIYVVNLNSNDISAYTINAITGALTQINCGGGVACNNVLPATGKNFAAGVNPSAISIDHTGQFAYVTNANDNTVSAYTINATTGALVSVAGSPFAAGAGPQSVDVDPTSLFVYVANASINTLTVSGNSVSAYTISLTTGVLTRVNCGGVLVPGCDTVTGQDFLAGTTPTSIVVDPTGNYVYVANNSSNDVSAFTITPVTGMLNQINCGSGPTCNTVLPATGVNFLAGTGPTSVAADLSGLYVYVANISSNNISAYISTLGVLAPMGGSSPFVAGGAPASITTAVVY